MLTYSNRTFKNIIKENTKISGCEFLDCKFENCKFTDCVFADCTFSECEFEDCSITNLQTKETNMLLSTFYGCQLVGISWEDLQSGSISFPIQKFDRCFLKYNSFENMNFKKFDFMQSSIVDSVFVGCNLSECDMQSCDLKNTEFLNCDLRKGDFRRASGYNIDLSNNRVNGAKFSYPEAINLLKNFGVIIEN